MILYDGVQLSRCHTSENFTYVKLSFSSSVLLIISLQLQRGLDSDGRCRNQPLYRLFIHDVLFSQYDFSKGRPKAIADDFIE